MKRLSLIFVILLLFTMRVAAQGASVRLDVVLHHINHIMINPAHAVTTLTYLTADDYKDGVELVQKEHLTVFSTGAYELKVKLADRDFTRMDNGSNQKVTMPAISVSAKPTTSTNPNITVWPSTLLVLDNSSLISSTAASLNATFDVSYRGPGNNEFIHFAEENTNAVYSNEVLYSLEPR